MPQQKGGESGDQASCYDDSLPNQPRGKGKRRRRAKRDEQCYECGFADADAALCQG